MIIMIIMSMHAYSTNIIWIVAMVLFHFYTAFIDTNCKIIEMMIIMSKNDKYQCVTAFVALYVSMYVCMHHISLNNGPGVYYL